MSIFLRFASVQGHILGKRCFINYRRYAMIYPILHESTKKLTKKSFSSVSQKNIGTGDSSVREIKNFDINNKDKNVSKDIEDEKSLNLKTKKNIGSGLDNLDNFNHNVDINSTYTEYFAKTYDDYGKSIRDFGNDLNHILEEFEKKRYNTTKIKYIGIAVGIVVLFMFWRTIKSFLSKETSDVAIRTMNDEEFQKQMYNTLLKTLNDARNDEQVVIMLADLINKAIEIAIRDERTSKLLHDEEFVKVLISVASEVINSEQTKKDLDELSSKEIQTQLTDVGNKKLLADAFYDAALKALSWLKPWGKKE
jgi:hypothetical protein